MNEIWKDIEENDPKHSLKDGQKVDLFLHKHDITGKDSMRLTDCTYTVQHGFLDSDERVVTRVYPYHIKYYMKVPEPPTNT